MESQTFTQDRGLVPLKASQEEEHRDHSHLSLRLHTVSQDLNHDAHRRTGHLICLTSAPPGRLGDAAVYR